MEPVKLYSETGRSASGGGVIYDPQ